MLSVITNEQLEKVLKKLYLNTDTNTDMYLNTYLKTFQFYKLIRKLIL